ncbi:MAG: hypothetical protein ACKPA7_00815, partial [Sphaerospermopsis kisseleviana]
MKIYQLISQGCALVLLTALPSFAETKNKVILVPGENLFPLKCETIQGSIDANDKIAPRGSLNDNFESRYDSYSVKADPGNVVFVELINANQQKSFIPLIYIQKVDQKTGLGSSISAAKGYVWYVSKENDKNTNLNLYIYSANSGTYNLRIAYARPSINLSESQIQAAIMDS